MAKGIRVVYNTEPYGYSFEAESIWKSSGFKYVKGSWNEVDETLRFTDVDILIVRLEKFVDQSVLSKFPNLKYLISATTGWDHLDLAHLKIRGIKLFSLRGHNEFLNSIPSTAEHTWALLMALIRNIYRADRHVAEGKWNRDEFRGIQLKDKTIGIVGLGRTGSKVADFAKCFGLNVAYFDPNVYVKSSRKCDSLTILAQISDFVSIHVHLKPDTANMINSDVLRHLKKGAFLINTSRSGVWNEKDVAKFLKNGHLSGVAADVLEGEPMDIKDSQLLKMKNQGYNVLLTPHIGGATWEAMWSCEEYIVKMFIDLMPD